MAGRRARDARTDAEPEQAARGEMDAAGNGGLNGAATGKSPTAIPPPMTARGEMTRRRILDAAEEVFGEVGYYEASVSEITRRAGVAQGTFYIYFRTKRDAFVELIEDLGNRLRAATSEASAGAAGRVEAERLGFAAFLQFAASHRRIYRLVEDADRVAPEAAREYYRRISQGYERGLRAAMRAGEIRETNAEAIATALMGIAHFMALRWLVWPGEAGGQAGPGEPSVPEDVFAAVMGFVEGGLTGADEATSR
jgi:AcrR family transcriptional regulator